MKEINLNQVRQAMKQLGTATKSQIASTTKLSVVTVNSLVKELMELKELVEDRMVPSNGGRPATTYRYDYDFSLSLIITMKERKGNDIVVATVINMQEKILAREEHVNPGLEREPLYAMIARLLTRYPSIKVIGIGIPGQVVDGEIIVSSHEKLKGLRIIEDIEQQFGLPAILENDVNAAISGFFAHTRTNDPCVLGLYFPERFPPGMGICLNGEVVKGKNGMAGEVKFLPLDVDWYSAMDQEEFTDILCRIIQILTAVLAPDKIVVYQNVIEEEMWSRCWESYGPAHALPVLPEIIFQDSFQEDFEAGMRWLTLKALEPSISI